jgi:hypothetical protein
VAQSLANPLPELAPGMRFGRCTLVAVGPVEAGGVPLTLRASDGTTFGVDVLRHDPACPGVARAGALSVYMRNGGTGRTSTHEEHGLAAMAVARLLADRPLGREPAPLLTLRERIPALAALYPSP